VAFSPIRLRIREGKFREPDLVFSRHADDPRLGSRDDDGADMVVEVVSPDGVARDFVDKRLDYAEDRIREYWIIDPRTETVTVLRLADDEYTQAGVYGRGMIASSALLPGSMSGSMSFSTPQLATDRR
jgi:Uma2 family endonuclease